MKLLPTLVSVFILSLPTLTYAQLQRTWVSGVGDDVNPGSRTAPCKTFAGAITKTAVGGVVDVLDPGNFGSVTITNSITIEGDICDGSINISGTNAITINATPTSIVILRNLSLEGLGTGLSGISIISAGEVHIENCRINGFTQSGISYANTGNGLLFVKDTTIHRCTINGISLVPTAPANVTIEHVNITSCGDGIDAATNTTTVVTDTTVSGNVGTGFFAEQGAQMTIKNGTSTGNNVGVQSQGIVSLSNSSVTDNTADGLKFTKPAKIISYRNNVISGNNPDGKASSNASPK